MTVRTRAARIEDLRELERLEEESFDTDRIRRRQWRHLLLRAHARVWLAEDAGGLTGSVVVLLRRGCATARLYSIAVASRARGQGVGRELLAVAEELARAAGCTTMRLEIREDNAVSIRMFGSAGYSRFAVAPDYYEDGAAALRFEKLLTHDAVRAPAPRSGTGS